MLELKLEALAHQYMRDEDKAGFLATLSLPPDERRMLDDVIARLEVEAITRVAPQS